MRAIAGGFLLLLSAAAQTPRGSLRFEVEPLNNPRGLPPPGRSAVQGPAQLALQNVTLAGLIMMAYDLPKRRVAIPEWVRSARFNISAKIPEETTAAQFKWGLQNLLADRFQLIFHREEAQMRIYDLVVAKDGPKMKEAGNARPKPRQPGQLKPGMEGFPALPPGRESIVLDVEGHVSMRRAQETMEGLAGYLSAQLDAPVNNVTGLKGKYDFTVYWIMDRRAGSRNDSGPDIFRALEEQLGLKLQAKVGPVEMLVVDHVEEKPAKIP